MIVQKGKKMSAELIAQEQARRQDSRLPTRARGFSEPEARKEATRSSRVLIPPLTLRRAGLDGVQSSARDTVLPPWKDQLLPPALYLLPSIPDSFPRGSSARVFTFRPTHFVVRLLLLPPLSRARL